MYKSAYPVHKQFPVLLHKNIIMDKAHLLLCPKLDQTSKELPKLYWDARRLME
jgi:hypothetical protein